MEEVEGRVGALEFLLFKVLERAAGADLVAAIDAIDDDIDRIRERGGPFDAGDRANFMSLDRILDQWRTLARLGSLR